MPIPVSTTVASPRTLLRDVVCSRLQEAILDGTFEPGEKLLDDELVRWLGVSRTPIREALSDLAHAGLVEISPNRSTTVARPDPAQVIPIVQTLGVLYGGAVRLAVPRLTTHDTERLVAATDVCVADLDEGDFLALNVHTVALFDFYVDHCGNAPLAKVCRDVSDGLAYRLRLPNIVDLLPWADMRHNYVDLREATVAGNAVAAELAAEALHQLPITVR